jgi:hemerythrin superfamily protein
MSVPGTEQSMTQGDDVVAFLQAQHREVEQLFSQLSGGGEARREPFQCLVQLLATHETAEEEVVYPALRSTGADGERIADERTAEEDGAKKALSELEKIDVTGDDFNERLEAFRRMVLEHAGNEEREVFPRLRQSLDPDKLRSMRTAVEAAERMAPTHPHPHAPESAVGNLLAGPFVAIADKVRDAIRGVKR